MGQPIQGRRLAVAGVVIAAASIAFTAGRRLPYQPDLLANVLAFSSYALLGYAVAAAALVASLIRRRTAVRLVALIVTIGLGALHASWIVPRYVRDDRPPRSDTVSVLSVNVWAGSVDPAGLAAAAEHSDLVILTEMTQPALDKLDGLGWSTAYPYRTPTPLPARGPNGTIILSRFPLTEVAPFAPALSNQAWTAVAALPEVGSVRVVAVHPTRPYLRGTGWSDQQQLLRQSLLGFRTSELRPMVVAGDFNAVDDHLPLRRLRSAGFRCVDDIAGAGWLPTFPARPWLPTVLGIDHVLLTRELTATSAATVRVAGTNHLGLRATIGAS